ncbi:MAG TPA: type II toxin-antitoxin system VapC family toxin [Conexibacter sp.]|nr:type II toxin-antitoxin system VapC family toxin [Conexibacter sp.]
MTVYFDTSAFIKLLIPEPGSDLAHDLWARADMVTSTRILYPEVRAAAAAIHRAGRMRVRRLPATVARIEELHRELQVVALDDPLARAAGDLAERHALRGYDAVHLASVLAIDVPGDLIVATWDQQLAAAAVAEGRMVVPAQP